MENVWIANIVTGGFVVGIITWLFNRFINSYDKRLARAESKAEEIEKNYIHRFEDMHKSLDAATHNLREHFSKEISEVIRDKSAYRIEQAKSMGIMETKLDNLIELVKRNEGRRASDDRDSRDRG